MYKLLCIDIDGTLRDECYGIPDSIHNAFSTCRNNGCQVIICTGRSMGTISDDVLQIPVDGYIAGGGSYIEYHKQCLCNLSFEQIWIDRVVFYLKAQDVGYAMESQAQVFMNEKAKTILKNMNQAKQTQAFDLQEKIIYEDTMHHYQQQPIHKICLWANKEVYEHVQTIFGCHMQLAQYGEYEEGQYYEIIQKGIHKGYAIEVMQKHLHITKAETISFGDGLNDLEMLEASGYGVAMQRAHPELKKIAHAICEDIMQDGIYQELKRRKVI